MRSVLGLIAASLLFASVPAQKTWIVDRNGGAGVDFTDLPPALAAAANGDTILVRGSSGATYTAGPTTKSLFLLGENVPVLYASTLLIANLPAGAFFVMEGFGLSYANVTAQACQGRVHIESVSGSGARITVASSRHVTITNCTIAGGGGPGLHCSGNGMTTITDSVFSGQNGVTGKYTFVYSQPGVAVSSGADVQFSGSRINGGSGTSGLTGATALSLAADAGTVTITGGTLARFAAGSPGANAAITATGGTLIVDPTSHLVPTGGAGAISGGASVTFRRLPAVIARGAPPGGIVQVQQVGAAGNIAALLVSLPVEQPIATAFGDLWLDLGMKTLIAGVAFDATEQHTLGLQVPADATLSGQCLAFQAVGGTVTPWDLALSPPSSVILH